MTTLMRKSPTATMRGTSVVNSSLRMSFPVRIGLTSAF